MSDTFKHSINKQRAILSDFLGEALKDVTDDLPALIEDKDALDLRLRDIFQAVEQCKYLYVLDVNGIQISSNITRYGPDAESRGRDRSQRPYLQHVHDKTIDCHLSQAYISRNKKRPSVTAIKTIRDNAGNRIGFLGVDFDLRELPHSDVIYEEPSQWRQIKGDPMIRQGLFYQERAESLVDLDIENVLSVHKALILDQGVHHIEIHFSGSRSTIWHVDDPYVYRILTMNELGDPNVCLAYPRRPYFERAIVPPKDIEQILKQFQNLRFADETIYLRSGSLNIVNGKVGLNFSCDGTHYLHYDEFLEKGLDFWFGGGALPNDLVDEQIPSELDLQKLDAVIENMAGEGCMNVNKHLTNIQNGQAPKQITGFNKAEQDYIYQELKSVMDVYDGMCSF